MLAEIGDARHRFADARGLKAYAGSSPITRASGKKSSITRRWVKNDRLNHAGYDIAEVTASQVCRVVENLVAGGRWAKRTRTS